MDDGGIVKQASTTDLEKAAALLETIRSENPKLWPNGLTVDHFSPGNLWLIQKSASDEPVGFVGWQARKVEGVPTGYYSIGVLPEYRHQGIAKKAVSKLLAAKAASVDRVRALVVPGNIPSENLARKLDVPVEKAAFWRQAGSMAKWLAPRVAGGATTTLMQDNIVNDNGGYFDAFTNTDTNGKRRNIMNLVNFAMGAGGTHLTLSGMKMRQLGNKALSEINSGATRLPNALSEFDAKQLLSSGAHRMELGLPTAVVGPMTKDLIIDSHRAISGLDRLPGSVNNAAESIKGLASKGVAGAVGGGAGTVAAAALLAAALGGGAYGISRALKNKAEAPITIQSAPQGGRLKVTLPTRNPTDSETTIDLPFDQFSALSPSLRQRIERDTRRRLHAETNARTRRIGTQALTAVA